jgi:phosphoribosylamine---glycine ligase
MKVLILGSGGREHALGFAIRQADPAAELVFCPGNGGTDAGPEGRPVPGTERNVRVNLDDLSGLINFARAERVTFTLVGPEAPLVAGVVDRFLLAGLPIFGPSALAARIEGSKVFAKTLMKNNGVPTPHFEVFTSSHQAAMYAGAGVFPKVIKADGLAAGKGVAIVRTPEEATAAVAEMMEERRFGAAADQVLVEDFHEGEEVSAFALARDEEFRLLPLAQDHKRIGDGDTGPNTGGMGAYAPFPRASVELRRAIEDEVFAPVLGALARGGHPFRGLLYAGLMLVGGRPLVLEFNCRFGDPETQAIVPLLGRGFMEALLSVATGGGPLPVVSSRPGSAATVVLASSGYPGSYRTGLPISGLEAAKNLPETFVFHAGTRREDGRLVTSGGRVLAVTGRGSDLKDALRRAYEGCSLIEFEGKTLRRDIGWRALSTPGGAGR